MVDALCHPDDLAGVDISSRWVSANSLCHPDDISFHLMSSGWLKWGWYLIWMSYGNGYYVIRKTRASFLKSSFLKIFYNTQWPFSTSVASCWMILTWWCSLVWVGFVSKFILVSFAWMGRFWHNLLQSNAIITRSNLVRYYINNHRNWGRISIRCWTHKKHPIPPPNRRAMGCPLWIFMRKLTAL